MRPFPRFFLPAFLAGWVLTVGAVSWIGWPFVDFRRAAFLIPSAALGPLAAAAWTWLARSSRKGARQRTGQEAIAEESPAARDAASRQKIALVVGGFCSGIVLTIGLAIGLYVGAFAYAVVSTPNNAGPFHREQMESLVAQVRSQKFYGEKDFKWAEVSGTARLLTVATKGNDSLVFAERSPDQTLKVVIVIHNEGHMGGYGFAYSDSPLEPVRDPLAPEDKDLLRLELPGPLRNSRPKMRIDSHWWEVFDVDE